MADDHNLEYLFKLLDDPSPVVQEALAREFSALGPRLLESLARRSSPPNESEMTQIKTLVADYGRQVLRQSWENWMASDAGAPLERLEAAMALIADFQNGPGYEPSLDQSLNSLAAEFRRRGGTMDEETLARFLFKEKGLEGDRSNYYHPHNSNLVYVIEARRGLPISLACIYMLVGRRLGMDIGGCNWPHHFFARILIRQKVVLVDCFNGGRMLDRDSFLKMQGPSKEAAEAILDERASVEAIVCRVLGNLVRAYQHIAHEANSRLMMDLLRDMEGHFGARR
jgi:regulator of sirC expression with transglutaminase-like and TPR domain